MIVILDAVILVDLGVGIFLSSVITSCAGLELVNHPSCFTSLLFFQKILATKILATKLDTSNYFSLKKVEYQKSGISKKWKMKNNLQLEISPHGESFSKICVPDMICVRMYT